MKGLEELEKIKKFQFTYPILRIGKPKRETTTVGKIFEKELSTIKRELTAFDIIALKGVNVGEFKCLVNKDTTYEQYVYFHEHSSEMQGGLLTRGDVPLSEREFNVVKESVLCHW